MSKILKVLAVDQFLHHADDGSWLEWSINHDPDGRPFVTTDEGQRVDEGDFVLTQWNGDRLAMKHIDYMLLAHRFDSASDIIQLIEVP